MTSTPGSDGPTAATTPPPSEPAAKAPVRRLRFSPAERWVHRTTAWLTLVCVATAAFLYVPELAQLVGRRRLVVTVHQWSGLLVPLPLLAGLGSRALRADLSRLNRFAPHDRQWLRAARRRDHRPASRPAGKFNAGQKLWAAWIAGALLVMLGTGLLMWFTGLSPLVLRTGATFVHDWLALAVGLVVAGHITKALADPEARRGMRTGSVERLWARREHPLWRDSEGE
ncbi:cytochrome b/b6 domain-containing protein [Streptomyces sp. NBC_01218]|uniref:cytochrome b/b6 domain-containing protein n=1 Tax=unclassified Streptomyces TaxID=2593676 RepID=UPI0023B9FC0F|nr:MULTISPECIES: cytochrome b/b6 domain-containing protein [unclassified Streptomyces]WEH42648.1 cytochrome b/b6 domain-containing protein [Streptomyces sp. AM 2-1-1]WSQ54272.1 cytochrome b/b6 domain-containing protein [Streptomyces sp. NBC_01218]